MMRSPHSVLWLAIVLLAVSGCKKKNKTVPVASQAPTISAPAPTPPVETKAEPAVGENTPPTPAPNPSKTAHRHKPRPVAKKPAAENATVAKATVPRIVVQPSPTAPGSEMPSAVVPDMSHTEEAHHRQTTEQLMLSTEANLKSLQRVLNADDRALLQQVRLFMKQAREASQAQDLVRAHNLALKAHLLSDELVR